MTDKEKQLLLNLLKNETILDIDNTCYNMFKLIFESGKAIEVYAESSGWDNSIPFSFLEYKEDVYKVLNDDTVESSVLGYASDVNEALDIWKNAMRKLMNIDELIIPTFYYRNHHIHGECFEPVFERNV